jgi:MarR-like DNA-binding transcriptional regulator SgrR of sgrS sRNA
VHIEVKQKHGENVNFTLEELAKIFFCSYGEKLENRRIAKENN